MERIAVEGEGDFPKPWNEAGDATEEGPGMAGSGKTGPGIEPETVGAPGREPGKGEPVPSSPGAGSEGLVAGGAKGPRGGAVTLGLPGFLALVAGFLDW